MGDNGSLAFHEAPFLSPCIPPSYPLRYCMKRSKPEAWLLCAYNVFSLEKQRGTLKDSRTHW